ncbi:hypothetical protein L5G32_18125 [Gordonia sp. HY002]|uniref:hypothetical protein n=1 Tax=Gordonia zhenghanii TaxID=2911516 RepID=UPI001EEFF769|nr:hypothetical protein [Gordonia zhenghanii]MCF8572180.1 hypothetical protein [Gordonia zhenghanii]MCF8608165.1 hypothetical protein [Gordonia zhenghanii]
MVRRRNRAKFDPKLFVDVVDRAWDDLGAGTGSDEAIDRFMSEYRAQLGDAFELAVVFIAVRVHLAVWNGAPYLDGRDVQSFTSSDVLSNAVIASVKPRLSALGAGERRAELEAFLYYTINAQRQLSTIPDGVWSRRDVAIWLLAFGFGCRLDDLQLWEMVETTWNTPGWRRKAKIAVTVGTVGGWVARMPG